MSTISSFRSIEVKIVREHTMKIIDFKKKKIKFLTKEQQESYENSKICYICKEKIENKYLNDKNYCKVRDQYHIGEYRSTVHSICHFTYSVPKKIGSNYDYHFIIKELAEEFKKQFTFLGENTEKCITFTGSN